MNIITSITMTMNADGSLSLAAIQIVLRHDFSLLNKRELGRLSIASKSTQKMADFWVWRKMFASALAIGRTFPAPILSPGMPLSAAAAFQVKSWNGEAGLLPFFLNPDARIVERMGMKHVCGCILSKHCFHCGKMAATANPLTMTRICQTCSATNEDSYVVAKARAKEAFLLGEKDLKHLVSVSHQVPRITGGIGTSIMYLMADVKDAAFAKYGGADGLAAEFVTRTEKAMSKYNTALQIMALDTSSKPPPKKRPKITKMLHRPADDLASIRSRYVPIFIGTSFLDHASDNTVKMVHSAQCRMCDVKGTPIDVMRHERFDHDHYHPFENEEDVHRDAPRNLIELANLHVPNELVRLLSIANKTYMSDSHLLENANLSFLERVELFDVSFSDKTCKIAVDFFVSGNCTNLGLMEGSSGTFAVYFQLVPNTAPVELVSLGTLAACDQVYEADETTFQILLQALELDDTTPAQLLAAVISRASSLKQFKDMVFGCNLYQQQEGLLDYRKVPILHEAYKIWMEATNDSDSDFLLLL